MVIKKQKTLRKKPSSKGEPKSMEELLLRFGDSIKTFSRGDKVKGVVIEKRPKSLVLDIGGCTPLADS